eukprot:gene13731-19630_t
MDLKELCGLQSSDWTRMLKELRGLSEQLARMDLKELLRASASKEQDLDGPEELLRAFRQLLEWT